MTPHFKILKETDRYVIDQLVDEDDKVSSTSFWTKSEDGSHFIRCFIRFHDSGMSDEQEEKYVDCCNYSPDVLYTRLSDKTLVAPASICSNRSSSRPHLALTLYVLTLRTCVELEQLIPDLASDPEWLKLFDGPDVVGLTK